MLYNDIFNIKSSAEFDEMALNMYRHQYTHNQVYKQFCDRLSKKPENVIRLEDVPFLPISFYKSHDIISKTSATTNIETIEKTFSSSGTTGNNLSYHKVIDLALYEQSFSKTFSQNYGPIEDIVILALLPSYLEQENSSLVYMVDHLIKKTKSSHSGFCLNELSALTEKIKYLESNNQKTILLGVSYALLDLIEITSFQLKNTIVMETGGMKGRRKELIKAELHEILKLGFGVNEIHSEYGMTELLSQAYSSGKGIFKCPPWMKVLTRDTEDALSYVNEKTGGLNIIDLANIHSCSFIATQDLGRSYNNGSFEILGRFDDSDIRGCNLMAL